MILNINIIMNIITAMFIINEYSMSKGVRAPCLLLGWHINVSNYSACTGSDLL